VLHPARRSFAIEEHLLLDDPLSQVPRRVVGDAYTVWHSAVARERLPGVLPATRHVVACRQEPSTTAAQHEKDCADRQRLIAKNISTNSEAPAGVAISMAGFSVIFLPEFGDR